MPNITRNVAVIGLGGFGTQLASELTRMGDRVVGIDRDPDRIALVADRIDRVMALDASDPRALDGAGIDNYDAVVIAIGSNIEASTLAAMNALDLGCPQIWAKASSPAHARILRATGIDRIVDPEASAGELMANKLHNPGLREVIRLGEETHIAHLRVPVGAIGRHVAELGLDRYDLTCLGVTRGPDIVPDACAGNISDAQLRKDDAILLHGTRSNLQRFSISG